MIADPADAARPDLRPARLLLLLALTACAWESPRGPGSDADPAEVDLALRELIEPALANSGVAESPPSQVSRAVAALAHENPDHVAAQWAAAVFSWRTGDTETARLHADRILAVDPTHVGASLLVARMAVANGNIVRARRTIDAALRAHPASAALHESSSWIHLLAGQPEAALASLAHADRLGAAAWRVAYNRGLTLESAGDREGAIRAFERCRELAPAFTPAAARLAAIRALGP